MAFSTPLKTRNSSFFWLEGREQGWQLHRELQEVALGCLYFWNQENRAGARGEDIEEVGWGGGKGSGQPWDTAGEGTGHGQGTELWGILETITPLQIALNFITRRLSSTLFTLILCGKTHWGHVFHSQLLRRITGSVPHLEILIGLLWDEVWVVRMLKTS